MEEKKDDKQNSVYINEERLALIKDVYEGGNKIILYHHMRKHEEKLLDRAGFKISEIPNDVDFCCATLPDGWKTKYINGSINSLLPTLPSYICYLIDEKDNIRGCASYFYPNAGVTLYTRYSVYCYSVDWLEDEDCDYNVYKIYFGNKNEVLYDAGQITILDDYYCTDELRKKELSQKKNDDRKKLDNLIDEAKKYANENYPDWNDELAYWDDEQKTK